MKSKKQQKYYSEVIRLYFEEGMTPGHICKIFPVCRSTIQNWICTFRAEKENPEVAMAKKAEKKPIQKSPAEEISELRSEVSQLRKELRNAKLRAEFYNEMINVAEDMFKIPIRKKAGAKQ